jgi:hypothetical protein
MTKGRDNAAESLSDVIELVRVRKQSGSLSVERYHGSRFEEGEIYFQEGQPTYAHTGQISGQQALSWMLTWHKIHFTFNFEEPRIPATISSAASTKATAAPSPPKLPRVTSSFGDMPGSVTESNNTFNTDSPDVTSGTPGLEWLVPQKMGIEKDVMSLPLTRPQRSIYMLVDGHRTISDLCRCTRKNFQEMERLLTELREQGLISI